MSLVLIGIFAILYLLFRRWLVVLWSRGTGELPAGPWPFPLVGDALKLDLQQPYLTFEVWAKQYGPLYSVMLGNTLAIVISDMELVKRAFKDDRFAGRPMTMWDIMGETMGLPRGPAGAEGDVWKEHRRFSLHALKDFGFGREGGEACVLTEARDLVQTLRSSGEQPIENRRMFSTAASNVTAGMLFGEKFNYRDARFLEYIDTVSINFQEDPSIFIMDMHPWLRFIPPYQAKFKSNLSRVQRQFEVLKQLVSDHKLQFDPQNPRDYIDAYLKAQAESRPSFSDAQLLMNIVDLFGASVETTSTFLRWAMLLMISFPQVQRRVQSEIDEVIGTSRAVAFADRVRLPYVEATILEVFRFANSGPFLLPHKTLEPVEFAGYNIPKDTTVLCLAWWLLRNPAVWEDPENFRPERFLDSSKNLDPVKTALVPIFSVGKRSCPGEPLARMETLIFFASILQNFTILGEEGVKLSLLPVNGLRPSGRLYCTISHTTMQNVDPAVSLDANQPQILCCKFNPTGNSILATTLKGFIIYALDKDGNVNVQHEYDVGTEIKFAERLYSTNLVAYATAKNPDVFVVFHCKRRKIVCDFRYPSDIDVVRFNRQRVIIAIKDAIYIHNVRNMQIVHLIKDATENPRKLMELAVSENCGHLAFPGKADNGSVRIFDVFQLEDVALIQASNTPLAYLKFDPTGSRIATASIKGTCIRVYDSANGTKLYEFRRGFKEVRIVSLSFSVDSRYLSSTSDSETIHIFKLTQENDLCQSAEEPGFFASVRDTITTAAVGLLNFEERAVTTIASPLHGQNAVGFLGSLSPGSVHFMLTTPSGYLHIFSLNENLENGGAAVLKPLKQHNLREMKKPPIHGVSSVNTTSSTSSMNLTSVAKSASTEPKTEDRPKTLPTLSLVS